MAKIANKRIYIIKERASRECHTKKIVICAQQEKKRIFYRERKLFLAIYKPTCTYLSNRLIVLEGISTIANK